MSDPSLSNERHQLAREFMALKNADLDENGKVEGRQEALELLKGQLAQSPPLEESIRETCQAIGLPGEVSRLNASLLDLEVDRILQTARITGLYKSGAHADAAAIQSLATKAGLLAAAGMPPLVGIPVAESAAKNVEKNLNLIQHSPDLQKMAEQLPELGNLPPPDRAAVCAAAKAPTPGREL